MEALVPIIMIIGVGIGIAGAVAGGNKWSQVAAELGLQFKQGLQRSISGRIEGFSVSIRQHKNTIEVRLSGGGIPTSLRLNGEGLIRNVLSGRDIEVGCPSFDARTHISSWTGQAAAEVSALLDFKTRGIVSNLIVSRGAKVEDGKITLNKSMRIEQVAPLVRSFVVLANNLKMQRGEIPTRLATNAVRDPVATVQLRNLTLLQQLYRTKPEATDTSRTLLDSHRSPIRLAAAMFLGPEGDPVVREMALSGHIPKDLRVKAIQHLTVGAKRENVIEIATTLLEDRDAMVRRMAIQSLGRLQHRPSLDKLVAALNSGDVATSLDAVKALANIGDPSAETALLGLLSDAPNRVKTAAIEALGKLGTVRAVEPLHPLSERGRFKRTARAAIESIQSRLGNVEAGRLSLAPTIDPEGALSLAGDPEKEGGLSLDKEDERRDAEPA